MSCPDLVSSAQVVLTNAKAVVTTAQVIVTTAQVIVTSTQAVVTIAQVIVTSTQVVVSNDEAIVTNGKAVVTNGEVAVKFARAIATPECLSEASFSGFYWIAAPQTSPSVAYVSTIIDGLKQLHGENTPFL